MNIRIVGFSLRYRPIFFFLNLVQGHGSPSFLCTRCQNRIEYSRTRQKLLRINALLDSVLLYVIIILVVIFYRYFEHMSTFSPCRRANSNVYAH